jgi:DNA-binding transcriptional MocR family regulator
MSDQGFLKLRNGILEHVEEGRFCLRTYGLFAYLLQRRRWASGVCFTNSHSIATAFGENVTTVQNDMRILREEGYIQYPKGKGRKGNYPVLIINDQPTDGVLKGYRLCGFVDETYERVHYESLNRRHTDAVLRLWGHRADVVLTQCSDCALAVPLLDIRQSRLLNSEDGENEIGETGGAQTAPEPTDTKAKKAGI